MTCATERVSVTDLGCEGTGELESQPGRPKVGHGCKSVAMSFRFTRPDSTGQRKTMTEHYAATEPDNPAEVSV
jgi:hypothetical protein